MKWLYLALNMGSFLIPFLYSFEKRMYFIKYWKIVFSAITFSAIVYLAWDIPFTSMGIWGFNADYLIGTYILGVPLEEVLFFFCIPYASIFLHYALLYFFPRLQLSEKLTKGITWFLLLLLLTVLFFNFDKWYTAVNYSIVILLLILSLIQGVKPLQSFYITFLAVLVPFFLVNGVLTGSWIDEQVVWYNDSENLGIRLGTIPVEDIGYAFGMLYVSVMIIEKFKAKYDTKKA